MNNEFNCKGKQLADYLVKNGFELLRVDNVKGYKVFVFEQNDSINDAIDKWEANKRKWLFWLIVVLGGKFYG